MSPGARDVGPDETAALIPCGVPLGAGAGESTVDISPPKAATDSTAVKANAFAKRFMLYAPYLTMQGFLH
jgi:hypothetical protein